MKTLPDIWDRVERAALDAGARHTGASPLEAPHADRFARWIERGRHAGMAYLEKNVAVRLDPRNRYPWARSVIAISVPYAPDRPAAPRGAISNHIARYALGDDYHDVLDRILRKIEDAIREAEPDARTWRYVDTGPLSDRTYAAQAGLGWIGKNGMLIDPEDGSWFFIGTLLTSLRAPEGVAEVADRCGECTRCIDACPTDAILPDREVDSHRCISYLTIEHRGELDPDLAGRLEGNLFGCDICQEVCPWNAAPPEGHPAFAARDAYRATPVSDLLRASQREFSTLFRRSAIKRAKHAGITRNAAALGAKDAGKVAAG